MRLFEIKVPVERVEEVDPSGAGDGGSKIENGGGDRGGGTRCDEKGDRTMLSRRFWKSWVTIWSARRRISGWAESVLGMTNTLHRFGSAESFRDDYVVFAIASKGRNDEGAPEKLRRFLRIMRWSSDGESG